MVDDDALTLIDAAQAAANRLAAARRPGAIHDSLMYAVPVLAGAIAAALASASPAAILGVLAVLLIVVAYVADEIEKPSRWRRQIAAQDRLVHRFPRGGSRRLLIPILLLAIAGPAIVGAATGLWWSGAIFSVFVSLVERWRRIRWVRAYAGPRRRSKFWPPGVANAALNDPDRLQLVAALTVVSLIRPSALADALGHESDHFNEAVRYLKNNRYLRANGWDGVGTRYVLNPRGRHTFRNHLSALEYPEHRSRSDRPSPAGPPPTAP